MAKVNAGPLISRISGSVGPVTYYRLLGRQVVRARVRPHQKITAARYQNRQEWKALMTWWRTLNPAMKGAWADAAYPDMYGVNLFIQLNRPVVDAPLFLLPPAPESFPEPTVCWKIDDPYPDEWSYHTWDPGEYPGFDVMRGFSSTPSRYPPSQFGHYISEQNGVFEEKLTMGTHLYMYVRDSAEETWLQGARQIARWVRDEITNC